MKSNTSKKQKMIAYLTIIATILTFVQLRNDKLDKIATSKNNLRITLEETIQDTILYLYNDNSSPTELIHEEYKNLLNTRFEPIHNTLNESNMQLVNVLLEKDTIKKTKKDSEKLYVYIGNVELQWASKETGNLISEEQKTIYAYLIQDKDTFKVANILLEKKKE